MDAVHEAWLRAKEKWHPLVVDEPVFRERVQSAGVDVGELATDDLYLAVACARGESAAIRLFEDTFFGEIDVVLRKMRCPELSDEIGQLLRVKVFVAGSRERPSIEEYRGAGSLRRWFRMVATRTILNARRGNHEQLASDDFLADLIGAQADPELEVIKQRYRHQFRSAFACSFASLEPRDQQLIRLAFRDQLTVDDIGAIFEVHRATAARWVARAHRRLMKRTRDAVIEACGISPSEFESVFKLIVSRLELTLEQYTADDAG